MMKAAALTHRIACLGAGYFAQFHHDAWQRNPGADLVAVCDLDARKAGLSGAQAFTDYDDMLEAIRPDIVDIITPPATHVEAILTALKHAPKAIICQKPFCETLPQAQSVVRAAQTAGVALIVHENFRFQPWYRAIRDAVQRGDVGPVHQVTFRLRSADGQGADAYLDRQPYFQTMPRLLIHETGVHLIDTFCFLMGQPRAVYADLRRMNPVIAGEDAGHFLLDFDGGARALFDGDRLLDHGAENCRTTMGEALVEGAQGTLSLLGDGSVHLRKFGAQSSTEIFAKQDWPGFGGDCVYHLQAHVTDALDAHGTFENTAQDYLRVIKIKDAIYRSDARGQKIAL